MCRYDVSTMLTLSLTKKYEGWWAAMLARKTALTLQDCLQGYTQEETLPVCPLFCVCCLLCIDLAPKHMILRAINPGGDAVCTPALCACLNLVLSEVAPSTALREARMKLHLCAGSSLDAAGHACLVRKTGMVRSTEVLEPPMCLSCMHLGCLQWRTAEVC